MDVDRDVTAAGRRLTGAIAGAFAVGLHLVVGVLVISSGLVAPTWAVALLVAVWLVLFVPLWRTRRTQPLVSLLVPFVAAAILWAAVTAGDLWLGWTA